MALTDGTFAIWLVWAALVYFTVLLAYCVVFVAGRVSRFERFAAFDRWYEFLLRRGFDGAYIKLTDRKSDRFVRFRKYIHEIGVYGIELTFPASGWGLEFLPRLEAYCAENGLTYALDEPDAPGESDHMLVDCRKDAGQARDLARKIWVDFFGLSEDAMCQRESENLLDYDDLVDGPDYRRPSPERIHEIRNLELARITKEVKRRTGKPGLSLVGSVYLFALFVVWFVSAFGLTISTLNSTGAPPEWSIEIANIALGGGQASLAFFLLFLFSSVEMFRSALRLGRFGRKYKWHEKFARVSLRLAVVALPVSVVLVWLGV